MSAVCSSCRGLEGHHAGGLVDAAQELVADHDVGRAPLLHLLRARQLGEDGAELRDGGHGAIVAGHGRRRRPGRSRRPDALPYWCRGKSRLASSGRPCGGCSGWSGPTGWRSASRSCWPSRRRASTLAIPWLTGRVIDEAIRTAGPRPAVAPGRADRARGRAALRLHGRAAPDRRPALAERRVRPAQSLYTHLQSCRSGSTTATRPASCSRARRATSAPCACSSATASSSSRSTGVADRRRPSLLLITSWQLALIASACCRRSRSSRRATRAVSHPVLRDIQQRIADVTTQAEESIVGVRVVKAFAQEDAETRASPSAPSAVFERELDSARQRAATARCSTSCRSSPSP